MVGMGAEIQSTCSIRCRISCQHDCKVDWSKRPQRMTLASAATRADLEMPSGANSQSSTTVVVFYFFLTCSWRLSSLLQRISPQAGQLPLLARGGLTSAARCVVVCFRCFLRSPPSSNHHGRGDGWVMGRMASSSSADGRMADGGSSVTLTPNHLRLLATTL